MPDGHAAKIRHTRPVRPSEGPDGAVRDRDVGALLLLRHGLAARALPGEVPAAAGPGRDRDRLSGGQRRRWKACSARWAPQAARLADLRHLHAGLRIRRRSSAAMLADRCLRPAQHGHHRRAADGGRTFPDDVRGAAVRRARLPRSSASGRSSRTSRRKSARFTPPATRAACAPIRSTISASTSARSSRR